MKTEVDQVNCIGCGSCVAIAPNTFKMNDDGKSEVTDQKGNSDEEILQGAKSCPVSVIHVTDDAGTKLWPES